MLHVITAVILTAITAGRADSTPVIDGDLGDLCWSSGENLTASFTGFRPVCDSPMSQLTTVQVLYDHEHIYFGCVMHDPDPSRINRQAGARDDDAPVDKIYVYLDTFNDDSNCYVFAVTVDGTQLDSRRTAVSGEDRNWDAVWSSAAVVNDSCWTAEIAIPFSALRYPPDQQQSWGVNFGRTISYTNEAGYLFRMKEQGGTDVSLFGELIGLADLPSSHGMQFRPFLAGRLQFTDREELSVDPWGVAGVDVKIPLGMQSVMDVSVLPDFGQVESDADQGSISHWAPWLNEKRPFFMEGTDVFDMPFSMFYSRSMGSVASNGELIQILGGTKITGTSGGLRYGALGVFTERVTEDGELVEPAASWFAGSIVREFSSTSWFKVATTSVDAPSQMQTEYDYSRSSSFMGMAEPWEDIQVKGKLGLTWNRSAENADNSAVQVDAGYFPEMFEVNFRYRRLGEDFFPERMGYFQGNGQETWSVYSEMSSEVDGALVNDLWAGVNSWYSNDMNGRNAGSGVNIWTGAVSSERYDLNLWGDYTDRWFDRYEGPAGRWYPSGFSGGISSSTDYRRPLAGWVSFNRNSYLDSHTERYSLGLRIKPVPEIFISVEPSIRFQDPATRYNWDTDEWELTDSDWRSLTVSATCFLNSAMQIRFNGQLSRFERNWQTVESSYVSEDIWGNLLYSWEFAPGSWFHFLAGEVQEEGMDPVFTIYTKLTRFF